MTVLTVAETVAAALRRHGVEMIFAQSLPSAVVLACEEIGIRQIAYRQENMGGAMADGYARVSQKTAIVCAQNGPAATLLVPPLAEALKASISVVALVQEVERAHIDKNAFQDLDQIALFSACSKWVRRLPASDRVDDYVDAALTAAGSGRPGPAVLLLPADLLKEPASVSGPQRTTALGTWPIDRIRPDNEALEAAARALARARFPVIYAGGGAVSPSASAALSKLQEAAHLPVFTTNMGKGAVAERHELSCGVLGALNGPASLGHHTQPIMDDADVVLLAGTRTNQNGTDSWRTIPRNAHVIHVDIDPVEIGRNYEAHRLVGDVATTLDALFASLSQQDLSERKTARTALADRVRAAWRQFEEDRLPCAGSNAAPIRPERVMQELQHRMTDEMIVVADASYSSMWIIGQLRGLRAGQRFLTPRGLAGLGWGLPLAIGAKLAQPESPVVALVGDGGFAHSWAELETLERLKVPLTIILLNNGILGYQKDAETVKFGKYTTACHLGDVDHSAIARACGCQGVRVDAVGDIGPALDQALGANKPALIEVMADPQAHPPISLYTNTLDTNAQPGFASAVVDERASA